MSSGRQATGNGSPPPRRVDVGQLKLEDGPGFSESELLPAIVRSSDDAIVGATTGGLITTWNRAAENIYGYRAAEIVGQPLTILCPAELAGEIGETLSKIGRGERVVHRETVRRRKDGTTFPVSVTASPIHDQDGRLIGVSAISRDITEQQARAAAELRRQADDLERANQSVESFTYSIAHDLRAPLRALGGYSSALMEDCADDLGEAGRGYAGRILAASQKMSALVDDLLRPVAYRPGRDASRMGRSRRRGGPHRRRPPVRRTGAPRPFRCRASGPGPGGPSPRSAPSCKTWWRTPGSSRPARRTR